MNPRYEKFLKTSVKRDMLPDEPDAEDNLPGLERKSPTAATTPIPADPNPDAEPASLHEIFRTVGNKKWLEQNTSAARANFNVFNLSLHPERPMADGVAVCVIKGTSFPDKSPACLEETRALERNESSGEVQLIPDPTNPYDSNALGVFSKRSGRQLGFAPKAADVNATYTAAINQGRLTGAYVLETKRGSVKGSDSVMMFLITGWLNQSIPAHHEQG